MRAAAHDETLLPDLAGLVERERATFADQNARSVRGAGKRLPFQLLVARVAELGDRRVATQLAAERAAAAGATTRIKRDHRLVFADQHLARITRTSLESFVAARVIRLCDGGITCGAPVCIRAAPRAATGNDAIE